MHSHKNQGSNLNDDETIYQIALTRIPQIGYRTGRKLLSVFGNARAIFNANPHELLKVPDIGKKTVRAIRTKLDLSEIELELKKCKRLHIKPIFITNEAYPQRLKQFQDAPLVLFYRGNASLNQKRIVSIIGTRRPSNYGLEKCQEIVEDLVQHNVLIASGLAFGIDAMAHRTCISSQVENIAVVAHGLDRIYPNEHLKIASKIANKGGILSEYTIGTLPEKVHFPMRNRLLAMLSDAIIVIESDIKGGSLITAEFGNQYHKDVFALPGSTYTKTARGCHALIKNNKAALIENAEDVLKAMSWDPETSALNHQLPLFLELAEEEQTVYDIIKHEGPISLDKIHYRLKKPLSTISGILLSIQCKGIIKLLPGNVYDVMRR